MALKSWLLFPLSLFALNAFSQSGDIEYLKKVVYTLAADSMQGRNAGTLGEARARNYILSQYKSIGLKPVHGSYTQKFLFKRDSTHIDTATNITGIIDNKADSTIIIGAHYDHIGFGGLKSRSLTSSKIHPGADDNASGVAMMLALAEHLKKEGGKKYNYLFVAFSAEEEGLYGSQTFAKSKLYDSTKIKLMINLVMVGRLNTVKPFFKMIHDKKDNCYDTLLSKTTQNKFKLRITDENIINTDAEAFIKKNITSLSFTTGIHEDYHKTSDVADKINYDGMLAIANYLENFLDTICKRH